MLSFNWCQPLYLDSSLVNGATEVALTKVDLYFRAKPQAENNKSGIAFPGVEVMILPCKNGIPIVNQIGAYRPTEPTEHGAKFAFYSGGQVARVEWDEIVPSADGSVPTSFLLASPAFVRTNQEYAITIKFDGNESFRLWENKIADWLVGTSIPSAGPTTQFAGNIFKFVANPNAPVPTSGYGYTNHQIAPDTSDNPAMLHTSHSNIGLEVFDGNQLVGRWNQQPGTQLKFALYVARYSHSGFPVIANNSVVGNAAFTTSQDREYVFNLPDSVVSNNIVRLNSPCEPQEYILFERENSIRREMFYGETIFQKNPAYPGGTPTPLTVTCAPTANIRSLVNFSGIANTQEYQQKIVIANGQYTFANGSTFNQVGGFNNFTLGTSFVFESSNGIFHEVRHLDEVLANNIALVDLPFSTNLANATFSISPIGFINDISPSYLYGQNKDIMILYDSTANDSVRFVGNAIKEIEVTNGGSGYSNSDYIRVGGFEDVDYGVKGNYHAYANIVTNGSGTITNIYLSNIGSGFVRPARVTGANVQILTSAGGTPSNNASSGSSAVLNIKIGSEMLSEFSRSMFANCQVINLDAVRMKPEITVNNPVGSAFTIKHRTLFYKTANPSAANGWSYFVNTPAEAEATDTYAKIFKGHSLLTNENKIPVIPSRSNQFITRYANGEIADLDVIGEVYSNAAMFLFEISSNNDYQACYFDPEIVNSHYANYIINREYTDEHSQYGKAWAKHITTKINLREDRTAEDLLVYLTAYKPYGSEIKVYGKIHNSNDPEEFDDKDWTLLDLIDGQGVYSSVDDTSDYIELTYNLPSYPNTEFGLIGSATVQAGQAKVVGTNTQFRALFNIAGGGTGYSNGDIIFAYPPEETAPEAGIFALKEKKPAKGFITTNGSGVISSIIVSDTGSGFVSQANVANVSFANSIGGTTAGSGATITYRPGVMANDIVKVYSPFFPETNYSVAVVESVANDTFMSIRHEYGDLEANSVGTVTVNTTSTTVVGSGTNFQSRFEVGDFIAVWSNTTSYEVRQIASIASNTSLTINEPEFTIDDNDLNYAFVNIDAFTNNSIAVSGLKIDKLHYEHQAFNNIMNDNVSRYYSISKGVYDGFNTAQIKIVMLSESEINVPKLDDCRAILTSS